MAFHLIHMYMLNALRNTACMYSVSKILPFIRGIYVHAQDIGNIMTCTRISYAVAPKNSALS